MHYAGWTDKLHAVLGAVNPVAMPYFGFTLPEPTGVVGVLCPDEPDVLGLVAELLPPLAAGNTVVALVSERYPLAPLDLGEIIGVSDVPAGVVNLIGGRRSELVPQLRWPPRPERDRRRDRRRPRRAARRARRRDRQAPRALARDRLRRPARRSAA